MAIKRWLRKSQERQDVEQRHDAADESMQSVTNPAEEDPMPFDDAYEIFHELERLSQKYEMTPGDDYYIQEPKVTFLAMQ